MQIIYGINPLLEYLEKDAGKVVKIVIARGRGGAPLQRILNLAGQKGIGTEIRDRASLDRLAGQKSHQGVVGICQTVAQAGIEDILTGKGEQPERELVLILDGITDPRNLGALIRTAHCCGAGGVIVPQNRSASVTGTVAKVSAGAVNYIPVAIAANLSRAIDLMKQRGFWIYGADAAEGKAVYDLDYECPVGLIMGSEGKGMRSLIKSKCDFLVAIPMLGRIDSLNVSVAAGIIMYEIMRKRGLI
ncbi:MAG: 23S rRNA (guanosine(2251)-2'-O)-methyltransferase RlmB [Deltaproteobacteria bacterium]|nr:23S rRNA (guanosine(2251)-2'-O)-methyltransferase RlmB [Deltaproteobacteria bacterium]